MYAFYINTFIVSNTVCLKKATFYIVKQVELRFWCYA